MNNYLIAYIGFNDKIDTTTIEAESQIKAIDIFERAYPYTQIIAITLLEKYE